MPDPYREPVDESSPSPPKIEKPTPFEAEKAIGKFREIPPQGPAQETPKPTPSKAASTPAPSPSPAPAIPRTPVPKNENLKDMDEGRQMKILTDMAFEEGIKKAVEAAKATGDAYLIDKLHDTLVDELRQQLIEKGKLKEE